MPSSSTLASASLVQVHVENNGNLSRVSTNSEFVDFGRYTKKEAFNLFDRSTHDYHHYLMAFIIATLAISLAPRSTTNSTLVWVFDTLDDLLQLTIG